MNDKPIAFLVYALCGMVLALSPTLGVLVQQLPRRGGVSQPSRLPPGVAGSVAGLILIGAALAITGVGPAKILTALAAAAWIGWRGRTLSPVALGGSAAIVMASARLTWWNPPAAFPPWTPLLVALGLFVLAVELLVRPPAAAGWTRTLAARTAPVVVFALLCAFFSFSTGLYTQDEILFTTWHHWSAYVGPAQLMRAGARILYDSPAQYGLGPTAAAALACGVGNCWKGMYLVSGLADLAYGGAMAFVALRVAGPDRGLGRTVGLLAAVFVACFLFTAYPPALATPAIAPSEGGLRFLPCALLLALLVACADKPWTWRWRASGHALWFFGLIWSPEAAFDATFVWCAYYLWRSLPAEATAAAAAWRAVRSLAVLACVLVAFALGFCALYYALCRVLPSPYAVVAYLLNPPGSAPFAFTGTFWFLALVFALTAGAAVHLARRGEADKLRLALPVLLGLYAVGSYYLGRSNDNNVLNLGPFMVLALAAVSSLPSDGRIRIVAQAGLCCLLAAPPSFGWSTFWAPAASQGRALRVSAGDPVSLFTFANPSAGAALDRREGPRNSMVHSADIEAAVTTIWRDRHEPVLLLAPPLVLVTEHAEPWAALHAPENFWFMPTFARRTFLRRTMDRLNRPGWVITQPDAPDSVAVSGRELARDFDAVYVRGESLILW